MNKEIQIGEKVTIDKLAEMVEKGFEDARQNLRTEIGGLEKRIDLLDEKFESKIFYLDKKVVVGFKDLNLKIDNLIINKVSQEDHKALENRVNTLEVKLMTAN